jgi:hypothetical protein
MDTVEGAVLKAVELEPTSVPLTFHLSGNSREVIAQVCLAFGIKATVDESVKSQQVRFDLESASWPTTMKILTQLTKTFFTPVGPPGTVCR